MRLLQSRILIFLFCLPHAALTFAETNHRALIVVDIDGTLGEQLKSKPDFSDGTMAQIPNDPFGDFYYYPGAISFIDTLFSWKKLAEQSEQRVDIALFTMGSGPRNELVRDFIEARLGLTPNSIAVFDYSEAVFSRVFIDKWRSGDPTLSQSAREYFDALQKPIKYVADINRMYCKDLSKLLPYYPGLRLDHIMILDDNGVVVPDEQSGQLIIAHPESGYETAQARLRAFLDRILEVP